MDDRINDPELYRRMLEPVESEQKAKENCDEFFAGLSKLRERCHIQDVVVIYATTYKTSEGKENTKILSGYRGNSANYDRLVLEVFKGTRVGRLMMDLIEEFTVTLLGG